MTIHYQDFKKNRLERCKLAADIAHEMIFYLSDRGISVNNDIVNSIRDMLIESDENFDAKKELCFWKAYSDLIELGDENADPQGIYFTRLYELGRRPHTPEAAEEIRNRIRFKIGRLAMLGYLLLTVTLSLLMYGAYIGYLEKQIIEGTSNIYQLKSGNYADTIYADLNLKCWGTIEEGPNDCKALLESLNSAVRNATFFLSILVFQGDEKPIQDTTIDDSQRALIFARQIIETLNSYLYPIVAGALGACVFLLRRVHVSIQNNKLKLSVVSSVYVRIAVGTIAGVVISWLLGSGVSSEGVTTQYSLSLTPLALAFTAGYAVEIFYSLLDRIIAAFSPSDNKPNNKGMPPS
ncbi:MAG: hypothetical protein ACPGOY_10975 [Rhodospirillaceae bacterium]